LGTGLVHRGFADVPITLQVLNVNLRRYFGSWRLPIRVEFLVYLENGTEIPFREIMYSSREYTTHPIHIAIDEKRLQTRFFADCLSDDELVTLLTKYYNNEAAARKFKLRPHFTDHNFRYWMVDVRANRQLTGLTVDTSYLDNVGVVDWTHLYPQGNDERARIHELINRLGRERQQNRRINAPRNRIRCGGGRRYGLGL
jgi:hypothetical protein